MPKKKSLNDAKLIAHSRNGLCLSGIYTDSKTRLLWQCALKHRWEATYNDVRQGSWCPVCARNKRKDISDCQKMAHKMGGKCISSIYVNSSTKLKWQCGEAHIWEAPYTSIYNGHWCPVCANNERKTIQDCVDIEKLRDGQCLSNNYINNSSKLLWQCNVGHKWKASYDTIQSGSWCPECSTGKTQKILAETIRDLLCEDYIINYRPDWLKNPKTKYNLEIDIYFPKSKLGIEYNGRQHYTDACFGKGYSKTDLKKTQGRDRLKKKLIKSNPDKIKNFIIFTYRNKIKTKNVEDILRKKGII